MKQFICLIFGLIGVYFANAFSPKDSIALKTINGKQFIIHKIEKGETLLSLSRRYKCSLADLKAANKNNATVKVGQRINIPFTPVINTFDSAKITVDESHANADTKEIAFVKKHIVQPGETLQKIASKYKLNTTNLIKWNNLKGTVVTVGQEIIVSGNTAIKPYEKWNTHNSLSTSFDSVLPIQPSGLLIEEVGFPQFTDAISHPTLKIGTVIICSNPINHAQKLLLVQHNHSLPQGAILGITPDVANQLKLYDNQQQITLKYISP